ncbi:hypothetical protein SHKM778_63570 [Streptomyces sp. KM77-8]|uniref:Uncharacterized protein n=1 Tax=Streptomyces haneummycinicus TaxID=3074435 RepID=A0AAT9HR86_9ACTN
MPERVEFREAGVGRAPLRDGVPPREELSRVPPPRDAGTLRPPRPEDEPLFLGAGPRPRGGGVP